MFIFSSIPWCAALLGEPGVVTFTPMSRLPNTPSKDQLFKTTLKTENAVPEFIGFYKSPFTDADNLTLSHIPSTGRGPQFLINSVSLLFDLRPGVNGFNGTAHGGFIASLFDEAMGCLLFVNGALQQEMRARGVALPDTILDQNLGPVVTASMNVKFLRPLVTPQVVMVSVTLDRCEGRKFYLSYTIKDGNGKECARGEGMWISLRKEKL